MKKSFVFCFILLLIGFNNIEAQIVVSPHLKNAIDAALENSSDLKNQNIEIRKAEQQRKAVLNKFLPKLSSEAGYVYLNNDLKLDLPTVNLPLTGIELFEGSTKTHNSANVFMANLTAKQVIFSGGQITYGAKALKAKNEGEALMMELKEDEIIKDIIHSLDQIKMVEEAIKLIQKSETRLDKETQRLEKAIANGLAIPYDRDKIHLARLDLESRKAEVNGKKQLLIAKIHYLTEYSEERIKSVWYEFEPIFVPDNAQTKDRNELKALDAFSKALDYNLKKEKGSMLPTLGAFASFGYASLFNGKTSFNLPVTGNPASLKINEATLYPNWMVGAALKWNIFEGFDRKHKVDEVKMDKEILQNKKEDVQSKINLQLKNNMIEYRTKMDKLAIAQSKVEVAERNLETADKQYKLGLISVTERLAAETDVYQASLEKVQALIEQRQAALEAWSATGTLKKLIQVK